MNNPVQAIPDLYPGATPYLCCRDAARALEFYREAYGAIELMRMPMPGGRIGHAEIKISRAIVMLSDEFPEMGWRSPQVLGGSPVSVMIYVEDVDSFVARAVAAGARVVNAVTDQFYGDRSAKLEDPFGHVWVFATHKEDVPVEEMERRAAAMFGGG